MAASADPPTSPELVLVAPPEEAELARRSLPLPVPPIPRFPTFPPPPVRARAHRAQRSWTYAVAAAVLLAFAIASAVVLGRSGAEPATAPAATHPAPTTSAPRPTTTAETTPTTSGTATTTTPTTTAAPPASTAPSTPPRTTTTAAPPKGFVPSRVFAWPAKPGAVAYVIRFHLGTKLVFERRIVQPRITLPESFEFAPGRYRWLVVPLDRNGKEGAALVASQFDVRR